jgi:hypothetical protein
MQYFGCTDKIADSMTTVSSSDGSSVFVAGSYTCDTFTIESSTILGPTSIGLSSGTAVGFVSKWNSDGTHQWLVPILPVSSDPLAFAQGNVVVSDPAGNVYVAGMMNYGLNWTGTAVGSLVPGTSLKYMPFVAKFSPAVSLATHGPARSRLTYNYSFPCTN